MRTCVEAASAMICCYRFDVIVGACMLVFERIARTMRQDRNARTPLEADCSCTEVHPEGAAAGAGGDNVLSIRNRQYIFPAGRSPCRAHRGSLRVALGVSYRRLL